MLFLLALNCIPNNTSKCILPQNYHSTVHYQPEYVFKMANICTQSLLEKNTHRPTIHLLLMEVERMRMC